MLAKLKRHFSIVSFNRSKTSAEDGPAGSCSRKESKRTCSDDNVATATREEASQTGPGATSRPRLATTAVAGWRRRHSISFASFGGRLSRYQSLSSQEGSCSSSHHFPPSLESESAESQGESDSSNTFVAELKTEPSREPLRTTRQIRRDVKPLKTRRLKVRSLCLDEYDEDEVGWGMVLQYQHIGFYGSKIREYDPTKELGFVSPIPQQDVGFANAQAEVLPPHQSILLPREPKSTSFEDASGQEEDSRQYRYRETPETEVAFRLNGNTWGADGWQQGAAFDVLLQQQQYKNPPSRLRRFFTVPRHSPDRSRFTELHHSTTWDH